MATTLADLRRDIAFKEGQVKGYHEVLKDRMFDGIDEPDFDDAVVKDMYDSAISELATVEADLRVLQKRLDAQMAKQGAPQSPEPPKWDVAAHPILGKLAQPAEPAKEENFVVGDIVEAKWTDKIYYKAKVTTVTGSQDRPRYTVQFIGYSDTLTLERESLRAIHGTKRKAETFSAPQSSVPKAPVAQPSSTVISAAPNLKPGVVNKAAKPAEGGDEPPKKKYRQIRSNKKLEENKNAWQQFKAKGPNVVKKDSMFRSGTEFGSRVGFTGSGKAMTKDQVRVKNRFKKEESDDENVIG